MKSVWLSLFLLSGTMSGDQAFLIARIPVAKTYFQNGSIRLRSNLQDLSEVERLKAQAKALRNEAQCIQEDIKEAREARHEKELADVDRWIEQVLVNRTISPDLQMLNTVDQVYQILRDERYSPEQVDKIFERLCDTCPIYGRDSLDRTPLLSLLIEAAGKLDEMEPRDNPNKRWNGHVERDLRKRLFAIEWGIDLNKKDEERSSYSFRFHLIEAKNPFSPVKASEASEPIAGGEGLYRSFMEYAWEKLKHSGQLSGGDLVPADLSTNTAVAKGMPEGTVVRITVEACAGKGPIRYARYALLETILPGQTTKSTKGIQVLNLVLFSQPHHPVLGVDLVTLPGNKHLLAMDAQPMVEGEPLPLDSKWREWHERYVKSNFEWGGDLPESAKKFFSPHGLWTRLSGEEAVHLIETKVMDAFKAHLDIYLQCVQEEVEASKEHHQDEYLEYRLENDPARPMLRSLYGPEWTERVLADILFPKEMICKE
jgi:phycoerythrobilin:ferredoxin oxidoreductase